LWGVADGVEMIKGVAVFVTLGASPASRLSLKLVATIRGCYLFNRVFFSLSKWWLGALVA